VFNSQLRPGEFSSFSKMSRLALKPAGLLSHQYWQLIALQISDRFELTAVRMSGAEHDRASFIFPHGIQGNSFTSSRLDFTVCTRIKQKLLLCLYMN
jgi:hypothetical protein